MIYVRKLCEGGASNMDQRMSKDKYYLNIADAVLDRSTCLRRK